MTDCTVLGGYAFQLGRWLFGLSVVAVLLLILALYSVFLYLRLRWMERQTRRGEG